MVRPLRARIDLEALRHNCGVVRRHCGDAHVWAVVKADAYGHGLFRTVRALSGRVDGFALLELDAALALRAAGTEQPLLLMEGFYGSDEIAVHVTHRLTPVLHRLDQVQAWAERASGYPAVVKLNTGMNRLGLDPAQLAAALALLAPAVAGGAVTLMTHFADADEERGVAEQWTAFCDVLAVHPLPFSAANSAALLRYPHTCGSARDWVRPGIMLYGASPFPQLQNAAALGLRPAMTLESRLIAVRELKAGDRIGYGGSFTAVQPMRIGIVACGYGDGYPRHAPSGTPVLVAGRRTRSLGRVSMDKICVDLDGLPSAQVGTPVTLWGEGLSADEVAAAAGTVSYELFCALARRVAVEEIG
ncbi:MAG: alanine racemase [Rhodocyclaceae bacterium]|jgi:alanine racemase|nr:alanine racemase [Rhodocyclaceae bacterium]